MVFYFCIKLSL